MLEHHGPEGPVLEHRPIVHQLLSAQTYLSLGCCEDEGQVAPLPVSSKGHQVKMVQVTVGQRGC